MADEDTNPLHRHSDDFEPEERQEPRGGLRGIANEVIRKERSKFNTPYSERDLDKEDRLIDRTDERSLAECEEPRFRTTEDAYKHLEGAKQEAAEEREAEGFRQYAEGLQTHTKNLSDTISLSSDEEKHRRANYEQQVRQLHQRAWQQDAIEKHFEPQINALNQQGQTLAAMKLAREVAAGRDPIVNEGVALTRTGYQWQDYQKRQVNAAIDAELIRLHPELKDPMFREACLVWAENKESRSRFEIAEWPPEVRSQLVRAYKQVERERYDKIADADIAKHRLHERGTGSDGSYQAARKSLKERGSVDDALNYIALKRRARQLGR